MIASGFNPTTYGPAVQALVEPRRLAELGPGQPNHAAAAQLEALTDETLFMGRNVVDRHMAATCRAALWLYHDYLDRSHEISQEIATPSGSYWHAIMHRREPDYSNSKYWLHRVGDHEIFPALAEAGRALANDDVVPGRQTFLATQIEWDPFRFVDLCQRVIGTAAPEELLCRWLQQREWELLFDHCYRAACGEPGAPASGSSCGR